MPSPASPDFWAWKSGIFRFKTTQITKDNAIARIDNESRFEELPNTEQQERIDLLERLLMEQKPTGHSCTGENLRSYTNILHQLGVAYLSQKNPAKAKEYLEEAVKQVEENSPLSAEIFNTLGKAYAEQRQFEAAISYYQKSLNISQKLENQRGEISSLFYLGNAYLDLRQFQQARDFYEQCLKIEQQRGDRFSQASTYHNLGRVAQELREYEQANAYYQQALEIYVEFSDRYSQASTYGQLGLLTEEQEKYAEARAYFEKALEIFVEYKDEHNGAIVRRSLERVSDSLGN